MIVTRFAPSPTGLLHTGHAFSALFAEQTAKKEGGTFLLRIENIDLERCKPTFEDAILDDLQWLGLSWAPAPRRQSEHSDDYSKAIERLQAQEILYPCFCSRRDIRHELDASSRAPHLSSGGMDGPFYPGTCRHLSANERDEKLKAAGGRANWRIDMAKAVQRAGALTWHDRVQGTQEAFPALFGDVVIARKDIHTSYHLSVTVDDALQGVTLVTRGEDLLRATDIHRLLQKLLDLNVPDYHHHPLMKDDKGQRLAKRDDAKSLRALREEGVTAPGLRSTIMAMW